MGRVLHLGPSWHGPSFMWAELVGAELVLVRVVLHPYQNTWEQLPGKYVIIGEKSSTKTNTHQPYIISTYSFSILHNGTLQLQENNCRAYSEGEL